MPPFRPKAGRTARAGADDAYDRPGQVAWVWFAPVQARQRGLDMWRPILAVALGAALGALLRWVLGARLNCLFPAIPMGTLSANLAGGFLVGLAIAYFAQAPNIAPEWRLFIITGFCGGLTTFSTFSAEIITLLQQERLSMALTAIAIHVIGSLAMTLLGLASWHWLQSR